MRGMNRGMKKTGAASGKAKEKKAMAMDKAKRMTGKMKPKK